MDDALDYDRSKFRHCPVDEKKSGSVSGLGSGLKKKEAWGSGMRNSTCSAQRSSTSDGPTATAKAWKGHCHAKDQLLRASQAIALNIAEGNGKASGGDRRRYFEIAAPFWADPGNRVHVALC